MMFLWCLMPIFIISKAIKYNENDYKTLKDTVYAEARGEPREGQIAVANVIINRALANKPYWGGSSIAAVCRQPYQFECWNGKTKIEIKEPAAYKSIDTWLRKLLDGAICDNTVGSDHYNNPKKEKASWVNNVDYVKDIGNHRFYRSKGAPHKPAGRKC